MLLSNESMYLITHLKNSSHNDSDMDFLLVTCGFFFLNTQSNISRYVSIKKTHTMTTRAALTEFIYILTFTKEDLFSSVSLCLLVCLTTGLHKNY